VIGEQEQAVEGLAPKRRRARGKGSLFKHGRVWWISVSSLGKRTRENTKHTDRRKAQEYLDAKLALLQQAKVTGQAVLTSELRRVTVREQVEALLLDYKLRKVRSLAQVRAHLGFPPNRKPNQAPSKILKAFGAWRVVDLSNKAVDQYVEGRLATGAQSATVNRETQLLGQAVQPFFTRLALPAPTIRRLPEDNVRQGFFERGDFEKVVDALPDDLRDFCRFGYLSGWRRGELASLRWADVDREGGVLRLRPEASKNGRGRTLVLVRELAAIIERRWTARAVLGAGSTMVSPFVFHRNGRRIVDFRKAWASACEAAGVPGRLFHDLRRTAVRNMVRAGVAERVAMEVSGHRTRSVFDRYNIVSEADLRAAVERTSDYVNRLPSVPTGGLLGCGPRRRRGGSVSDRWAVRTQAVHRNTKGASGVVR
jgi:integrase